MKLGTSFEDPFRVVWEWWVPMDFRLEHINTNGALLVVNPSGAQTNLEFTCQAVVLPTNIPDETIYWSCTNTGMSFVGGVTNGRTVQLVGSQPGDWEATVTVRDSTLSPAKLRGTILEKKTVMVYLHIVCEENGTGAAMEVSEFEELLNGANIIHKQSGIEFLLASNVIYIRDRDLLTIPSDDNELALSILQSSDSHTGGLEVYCVRSLAGARRGVNVNDANSAAGLTIEYDVSAKILAHEFGHACGLKDIFTARKIGDNTIILEDIPVMRAFMTQDWCHEAPDGGYGPLHLPGLVRRLLMNSLDDHDGVDIPLGSVWGIWKDGHKADVPVGVRDMSRQPHHW